MPAPANRYSESALGCHAFPPRHHGPTCRSPVDAATRTLIETEWENRRVRAGAGRPSNHPARIRGLRRSFELLELFAPDLRIERKIVLALHDILLSLIAQDVAQERPQPGIQRGIGAPIETGIHGTCQGIAAGNQTLEGR